MEQQLKSDQSEEINKQKQDMRNKSSYSSPRRINSSDLRCSLRMKKSQSKKDQFKTRQPMCQDFTTRSSSQRLEKLTTFSYVFNTVTGDTQKLEVDEESESNNDRNGLSDGSLLEAYRSREKFRDCLSDMTDRGCSLNELEDSLDMARSPVARGTVAEDLDDVIEEWDENEKIPTPEEITYNDVIRIQKGMVNGKLYNLPLLKEIFNRINVQSSEPNVANSEGTERLRCPLCSRSFATKFHVNNHIESTHTIRLITCQRCTMIFKSQKSCWIHQCEGMMQKNDANSKDNSCSSLSNKLPLNTSKDSISTSAIESVPVFKEEASGDASMDVDLDDLIASQVTLEGEKLLGTLIEPPSTYFDDSSSSTVIYWNSDHGNNEACKRIQTEDEQFKRFFGNISDCLTPTGSHQVFQRRKMKAELLNPDKTYFKDLDGVEEWDLSKPLPRIDVTPECIKRIKKGMMNGRLYNMSHMFIKYLFNNLTRLELHSNWCGPQKISKKFKCPLCSHDFQQRKSVYRHTETTHTSSLILCMHCKTLLTSAIACNRHRCENELSSRGMSQNGQKFNEHRRLQV